MNTSVRVLISGAALAAGAAATAFLGGCGASGAGAAPATVKGRVTFNGKPVVGGLVVFTPNAERGSAGKPAFAATGTDGAYTLHLGPTNAIPPGWYRISLAPAPSVLPPDGAAFPAQLARPDMSGLEREVKPGKEHVFEFAVEVPPG